MSLPLPLGEGRGEGGSSSTLDPPSSIFTSSALAQFAPSCSPRLRQKTSKSARFASLAQFVPLAHHIPRSLTTSYPGGPILFESVPAAGLAASFRNPHLSRLAHHLAALLVDHVSQFARPGLGRRGRESEYAKAPHRLNRAQFLPPLHKGGRGSRLGRSRPWSDVRS